MSIEKLLYLLVFRFISWFIGSVEESRLNKAGASGLPPKVLTVRELSEYLRVHPTTVYRLLRAKQLPGFRVGSEWRFSVDMIDRWRSEEETASVSTRRRRKRA
ncbi:MAG TPA: helix-turn-helix domain-containing protein [Candidatus Binataceae bacterium]|nr:helix-turn-helix domain-containing protein [Candidatus Binataceae bacterium]